MSLKANLQQIIKDRHGEVFTLNELEDYCHKYKAKLSQAERRLRPSDSPDIQSVWNEKHTAIIGYRWKGTPTQMPKLSEGAKQFLKDFAVSKESKQLTINI